MPAAPRRTFRTVDTTCFLKSPAGWQRVPRQRGLASGMLTAVTVLGFNATAAFSGGARQQQLERAPLLGTQATWAPPPAGYQQGRCEVLPNSNAQGAEVRGVFNTTAEAW